MNRMQAMNTQQAMTLWKASPRLTSTGIVVDPIVRSVHVAKQ